MEREGADAVVGESSWMFGLHGGGRRCFEEFRFVIFVTLLLVILLVLLPTFVCLHFFVCFHFVNEARDRLEKSFEYLNLPFKI